MSRSLFDITEDFIELESRLDALDLSQDDSELLAWMTTLSQERAEKTDAYGWMIRKLNAEAENAKAVAAEFTLKQKTRENKVALLKNLLKQHMDATQTRKLIGKQFTIAIQANGGQMPVEIDDENAIPAELCRVERVPLRAEIRAKLERGEYVPGARLGERGESLRVK